MGGRARRQATCKELARSLRKHTCCGQPHFGSDMRPIPRACSASLAAELDDANGGHGDADAPSESPSQPLMQPKDVLRTANSSPLVFVTMLTSYLRGHCPAFNSEGRNATLLSNCRRTVVSPFQVALLSSEQNTFPSQGPRLLHRT